MAHEDKSQGTGSQGTGTLRGFASMAQEKQREIARKGGANVPHEKRSFAQNRELAAEAGRKGGRAVKPQHRSFAQNRALAAEAGRKGGQTSQSRRSSHSADQPASGGRSEGTGVR
ncbi:MAG TPA: KGG domain-containing protein [Hyphomicrobiaceae bacterium]|nr:KGG domain-containing protein [Hyphomicrobiaceae bacterium]